MHIKTFVMNAKKDTFSLFPAKNKKSVFLRTSGNHFGVTKLVNLRKQLIPWKEQPRYRKKDTGFEGILELLDQASSEAIDFSLSLT